MSESIIGQSLGRYHILEQLGEGGMATVYKAYDTRLERDVAIKIIRRGAFPPDQLKRILKRFEREAKALAKRPEDRFRDMTAFATALEGLIAGKSVVEAPSPRRMVRETKTVKDLKPKPPTIADKKHSQLTNKFKPLAWTIGVRIAYIALIAILIGLLQGCSATFFPIPVPTTTFTPSATNTPKATSTPSATHTPTATSTPLLTIGSSWTRPADGMEMMYIPAGEFQMGSVDGGSDEQPVHTVYLDSFWIDQTEVTNAFYAKCIDAGVCHSHGTDRSSNYYNHPVASIVSWDDAEKYCAWVGACLPTEAEWEKAARGGLTGKKYPWGDESPTCTKGAKNGAHVNGCSSSEAMTEVKSFAPNGYGLYDMVGNAWEWVADWYDSNYYSISPSSNPQGPASGQSKVLRGGTWNVGAYPAHRFSFTYENYGRFTIGGIVVPPISFYLIGFRCARSAP